MSKHECKEPRTSDFQDGSDAYGCWEQNGSHFEQVVGSSGVYLIETDIATGDVVRDDRPWQMKI